MEIPFQASSDYPSAAAFDSNKPDKPDSVLRVQCLIVDQVADENGMGINPRSKDRKLNWPIMKDWARVAGVNLHDYARAAGLSLSDNSDEEDEESDREFVNQKPERMYFNGDSLHHAFFSSMRRGLYGTNPSHNTTSETELDRKKVLEVEISMEGDWVFFRSPRGYMGLADSRALPTDCVCVLLGASVPFVLRRQENHYLLIGEAYVHGLMYGEAIEMMRSGSLEVKTIDIY
ncbi:hypothetical protein H2199_008765 [Coniosporium tulheliwenetii]|uniref:Uncharacterized protein n=1 Tax=Coniosporium tulheliwenetii TaxID=3383036 RepID=A0ACC2YHY8_9PEZI|nr:hypothetical protein H2199_008765 [Cladosporium sp. JES 115]